MICDEYMAQEMSRRASIALSPSYPLSCGKKMTAIQDSSYLITARLHFNYYCCITDLPSGGSGTDNLYFLSCFKTCQ